MNLLCFEWKALPKPGMAPVAEIKSLPRSRCQKRESEVGGKDGNVRIFQMRGIHGNYESAHNLNVNFAQMLE